MQRMNTATDYAEVHRLIFASQIILATNFANPFNKYKLQFPQINTPALMYISLLALQAGIIFFLKTFLYQAFSQIEYSHLFFGN